MPASTPKRGENQTLQRSAGRIGVVLLAAAVVGLVWTESRRMPKRFAEVVPAQLYRSGRLTPQHVAELRRRISLQRVISLLDPSDDSDASISAEREACEKLGIRWENVPMRGNGDSTAAARARLIELLRVPNAGPTLVHCAAGSNRTGLAIGLHRVLNEGWSVEQALAEMQRFDFEPDAKHQGAVDAIRSAASQAARAEGPRPRRAARAN